MNGNDNKKQNAYKMLGWIAMLLTPIGATIFFGWRVYTAVVAETSYDWLAIPAGIAAAVGLEMVGIFAGHLTMELWQRRDMRGWLAAAIMAVYVAVGVIELVGTVGMVMFVIAPLVYVLVGLRQTVDEQVAEETAVSQAKFQYQLDQAAADRELERELKRKRQEDATAVEMAKIESTPARMRKLDRQENGNLPHDWRRLSQQQRHDLAHATREERDEIMPDLAARTRRLWHNRLDKIAAQNGNHDTPG